MTSVRPVLSVNALVVVVVFLVKLKSVRPCCVLYCQRLSRACPLLQRLERLARWPWVAGWRCWKSWIAHRREDHPRRRRLAHHEEGNG